MSDFRINTYVWVNGYHVQVFDLIEEAAHEFGGKDLVTTIDNAAQWLYAGEYTDEQYENYERWAKE